MPAWLTRVRLKIRAALSRRHDGDLRHELSLHLQLLEEEYAGQGMSPQEARARAHRDFGNATLLQEASHDLFSFRWLENVVHDVTYACREMRRHLGFTVVAVASLAFGIGSVTATFAVIDAFMLRGLSVSEPEQLVAFTVSNSRAWRQWPYVQYQRWRYGMADVLTAAASMTVERYNVSTDGKLPDDEGKVRVSLVSGTYFPVLRAPMAVGSALTPDDDRVRGAHPVAVISEGFWTRRFGRTPDIVGRTIGINGVTYAITGVTGNGFTGEWIGLATDVWIPLAMHGAVLPDAPNLHEDEWGTASRTLRVIARRAPHVSREQAEALANVIHQRFMADRAAAVGDSGRERLQYIDLLEATDGYSPERAFYFRPLMILSTIVGIVLVVACANFANLLLGRTQARGAEWSVRLALGAGRWRLMRQSLTECALLAVLGGVFGFIAARWVTTALLKELAVSVQSIEFDLPLDWRVLAVNGSCVLFVLLVGIWPATRGARSAVALSVLQRTQAPESRRFARLGPAQALIAAQLALCTVLLIGATLFLRTVLNLRSETLGFARNVLLVSVAPGQAGYSDRAAAMLIERARAHLETLPHIQAVSATSASLLNNTNYWIDDSEQLSLDGGAPASGGLQWTTADVSAGYFKTIGMPLLRGREFAEADVMAASSRVQPVVINRTLARFLFGEDDPIGRRIGTSPGGANQVVVGVVSDGKQTSPRDRGLGVVYLPLSKDASRVVFALRTGGDPAAAAPMVRHQLRSIAHDLPILGIQTIEQQFNVAISRERLLGTLSLMLGGIAVLIACVGLHALLSYDVAQRTREIGVRVAMGATSRSVVALVLRDSLVLVGVALAVGIPIGVSATRPLTPQLYGVQAGDPATVTCAVLLLVGATGIAMLRPARAAARTDPVLLLRQE
jgi:predicted permease